eukprot:scaffold111_cov404-Prasinococcus_capsulatus_cf.AAC.24
MRAVLQRVLKASVSVDDEIVSSIGPGLLVLVGIRAEDTDAEAECRKVLNSRLFHNDEKDKPWDLSVMQTQGEVLFVSQFTLYGILKGNKPDWHNAMPPQEAKAFYNSFLDKVRQAYEPDRIRDGVFGAKMKVDICNDGPVTLILDSGDK